MKAKSFFYACAGIFLLVAAYTLGARQARADLDHGSGSHVIGFEAADGTGGLFVALRSDGTQWQRDGITGGEWRQTPVGLPPVPIEDVIFWNGRSYGGPSCMTKDGYAWQWSTSTGWVRSTDVLPTPPIAVHQKTWSGVKEGYRGK